MNHEGAFPKKIKIKNKKASRGGITWQAFDAGVELRFEVGGAFYGMVYFSYVFGQCVRP